jgi:hypothetical protein
MIPGQKEVNEMTVDAYPSYAMFTFAKPVASQMEITVQGIGTAYLSKGLTQIRLSYGEEIFSRTLSLTVSPAEDDEYIYDAPSTIVIPAKSDKTINNVGFSKVHGDSVYVYLDKPAASELTVYVNLPSRPDASVTFYAGAGDIQRYPYVDESDIGSVCDVSLSKTEDDTYKYVAPATITIE